MYQKSVGERIVIFFSETLSRLNWNKTLARNVTFQDKVINVFRWIGIDKIQPLSYFGRLKFTLRDDFRQKAVSLANILNFSGFNLSSSEIMMKLANQTFISYYYMKIRFVNWILYLLPQYYESFTISREDCYISTHLTREIGRLNF